MKTFEESQAIRKFYSVRLTDVHQAREEKNRDNNPGTRKRLAVSEERAQKALEALSDPELLPEPISPSEFKQRVFGSFLEELESSYSGRERSEVCDKSTASALVEHMRWRYEYLCRLAANEEMRVRLEHRFGVDLPRASLEQLAEMAEDLVQYAKESVLERTDFYAHSTSPVSNLNELFKGAQIADLYKRAMYALETYKRLLPGLNVYRTYVEKGDSK